MLIFSHIYYCNAINCNCEILTRAINTCMHAYIESRMSRDPCYISSCCELARKEIEIKTHVCYFSDSALRSKLSR